MTVTPLEVAPMRKAGGAGLPIEGGGGGTPPVVLGF